MRNTSNICSGVSKHCIKLLGVKILSEEVVGLKIEILQGQNIQISWILHSYSRQQISHFLFFLSVYPLCLVALVSLLHYTRWPSSFHGNSKTLRTKFLHFRLLVPRWLAFHKSSCWNFRYYYQYFKKSKISKQLPTIKLFKLGKMSGYFVWGWILLI